MSLLFSPQEARCSYSMAENAGRRVVNGLVGEKRGSRIVTRDCNKAKDQDILLCDRIGCSGRLSSARSTRNLSFDKSKVLKPSSSMCSSSAKVMTANPLNKTVKGTNFVKPLRGLRNKSLSVSASSSDAQDTDVATVDLSESQSGESASSRNEGSNVRIAGSNLTSFRISGVTKSATQLSRPNVSTTRPGSRYLRCGSVSAVAASDSTSNSRKQMLKKRSSEEEESNSSSRAKQPTIAETTRTPSSRNGVSISEVRQARRSQTSLMDDVSAMVRARRSDNSTSRRPTQISRRASATDQHTQRLPYSLSATGGTHRVHSHNPPITTADSQSRNLASSTSEVTSSTSLIDHEGFRHYNINGIAEVLLALDQIEHDQEISFEQLFAMESNLFLNGLNFHDQHRDMRLDIDGMSYEELLALEERMGSVSTALSEEALAKSIKKSTYNPKSLNTSSTYKNESEDDPKCSICQEEYNVGDETGSLKCKHKYHVDCINQWLRQKNWCPICKSSAASSSSSSSSS